MFYDYCGDTTYLYTKRGNMPSVRDEKYKRQDLQITSILCSPVEVATGHKD